MITRREEVLVTTARTVIATKGTAPAATAAVTLNHRRVRTQRGGRYDPNGRGIYKTIHVAYDNLSQGGRQADADDVARAFTRPDGTYAYR